MLFKNVKVAEAVAPYEEAVRLQPDSALLRTELGQVQIEADDPALTKRALANLSEGVRLEQDNGTAWHFLGVAYGRENDIGMAARARRRDGGPGAEKGLRADHPRLHPAASGAADRSAAIGRRQDEGAGRGKRARRRRRKAPGTPG